MENTPEKCLSFFLKENLFCGMMSYSYSQAERILKPLQTACQSTTSIISFQKFFKPRFLSLFEA